MSVPSPNDGGDEPGTVHPNMGAMALDLGTMQPGRRGIVDLRLKSQEHDQNSPVPPTRGLRFRGKCLALIGQLYPDVDVLIHRMGSSSAADVQAKGHILVLIRDLTDEEVTFRVTITQSDTPNESGFSWFCGTHPADRYTAEEYCDILKLAPDEDCLGRMMMITVHENGLRSWHVIRQIPGKIYSIEDCYDLFGVGEACRREIPQFGAKSWVNGAPIPGLWISKDLKLDDVANKIRLVMR